jgi:hypothetical protein
MEARKNERDAVERAAGLEGKVEALQTQLAHLTASMSAPQYMLLAPLEGMDVGAEEQWLKGYSVRPLDTVLGIVRFRSDDGVDHHYSDRSP